MNKRISFFLFLCITTVSVVAQMPENTGFLPFQEKKIPEPFLFSMTTLTPGDMPWSLNYSGSYGKDVAESFGYNGVGHQIEVNGYAGNRFTFYARAAFGFPEEGNSMNTAQQVEVIRDFIGGKKKQGFRLGAGLGAGKDFGNAFSLLSRVTASLETLRWVAAGNMFFEKTFAHNRDKIDVITSVGIQYRFSDSFCAGIESVAQDIEGLWEEDEAEGGAKILAGPTVNFVPGKSRFSFSMSGGPVMYVTRSEVTNPNALRELPDKNGLMLRARIIYNLSGI